jgi:PAP2 superfamily
VLKARIAESQPNQPQTSTKSAALFFAVLLSAVLVLVFYVVAINPFLLRHFFSAPFFAWAMAGVPFIVVRVRRRWWDLAIVAAIAASFFVLEHYGLHYRFYPLFACSFLGLASILLVGVRAVWERNQRQLLAYAFVPAVLLGIGAIITSLLLGKTPDWQPKTMDLYLLSFDGSLRVQLSFLVGQIFDNSPGLLRFLSFAYDVLMLPLVLIYAMHLPDWRRARNAFVAFAIAGPIGALCYLIVPGTGPLFVFGNDYPQMPMTLEALRQMALHPIVVSGARNAMPSLHVAWMLLGLWNTHRQPRWLQALLAVMLILTVIATLALGQHYFIDLVVAVPFALMIQSLSSIAMGVPRSEWRIPLVAGLGLLVLNLAVLTYCVPLMWTSPVLPWALVLATIAISIYFYNQLRRNEDHFLAQSASAAAA